jgi:hypothetical protein
VTSQGVMRTGNPGLNNHGGKNPNNPTWPLSNASVPLLFFVVFWRLLKPMLQTLVLDSPETEWL